MNVYTLEIFIIGGPVTRKFAKKNPVMSRTIEIQGEQTLEDLHYAIFEAFDREDNHMYEFQVGGKARTIPRRDDTVCPDHLTAGWTKWS